MLVIYPITAITGIMSWLMLGPRAGTGMMTVIPSLIIASQMARSVQQLMLGGRAWKALATFLIAGPLVVVGILLAALARPFPLDAEVNITTSLSSDPGIYLRDAFAGDDVRLADGSLVQCWEYAEDCRKRRLVASRPFLEQQMARLAARDSHIELGADDMEWWQGERSGWDMRYAASPNLRGDMVVNLNHHGRMRVLERRRLESGLLVLAAALLGLLLPTLLMEGRRPMSRWTRAASTMGMSMLPIVGSPSCCSS